MSRPIVEGYNALDIGWLAANGYLPPRQAADKHGPQPLYWQRSGHLLGEAGSATIICKRDAITVAFKWRPASGGEWQTESYTIMVLYTPMPRGGERAWLACPGCGTRAGKLYMTQQRTPPRFLCRACIGLIYHSQTTRTRNYDRLSPTMGLERTSWGRKLLADIDDQQPADRADVPTGCEHCPHCNPQPKRKPGRPRSKRKYTRHVLA